MFDVKDYGAVGDGCTKDTRALQNAIDACANAGGGMVYLPAGHYLSGTIWLKSHVEFHLCAGAVLVGSPDREDYCADDAFPENRPFTQENVTGAHLIIALREENVVLSGAGVIDGNLNQFTNPLAAENRNGYRWKSENRRIRSWRPGQMVFFCRCRNSFIRDLSLLNAPYWSLFLLACEDIQIRGLRITNPPDTQNGDGLDIDCCRNVTVSDCIIRSGDDSITLRGTTSLLGGDEMICENITVSNCILSTPCNAIRVGVGDGTIRRCLFNNIVITEARTAISIVSRYSMGSKHGARIEGIQFTNFHLDVCIPINISSGRHATFPAGISNISFSNFQGIASAASQLLGTEEIPLRHIHLKSFRLQISGGTENDAYLSEFPSSISHFGYHGKNGDSALPCAFYGKYLQDVVLEDIQIRWEEISGIWRDGFFIEQSCNVRFQEVRLRQPQPHLGAAIRCREITGLFVRGCSPDLGTTTFLDMDEASQSGMIRHSEEEIDATAVGE